MPTEILLPLPPYITPSLVTRVSDQATVQVITVAEAARLAAVSKKTIETWIGSGKLAICYTPDSEVRVFVDRLWEILEKRP